MSVMASLRSPVLADGRTHSPPRLLRVGGRLGGAPEGVARWWTVCAGPEAAVASFQRKSSVSLKCRTTPGGPRPPVAFQTRSLLRVVVGADGPGQWAFLPQRRLPVAWMVRFQKTREECGWSGAAAGKLRALPLGHPPLVSGRCMRWTMQTCSWACKEPRGPPIGWSPGPAAWDPPGNRHCHAL